MSKSETVRKESERTLNTLEAQLFRAQKLAERGSNTVCLNSKSFIELIPGDKLEKTFGKFFTDLQAHVC